MPETLADHGWVPTEYEKRNCALHAAVNSGAKGKDLIPTATAILDFLTAGNVGATSSKPAASGAKAAKADAPATGTDAAEPPSEKPADKVKADAKTTTSPSDKGSGFAPDGSEISKADVIAAMTKFVSANDEASLLAVLGTFNAAKVSEIEVSDYAALIEALALPTTGAFD